MDIITAYMIVLLTEKGVDVGEIPADKFDAWTKNMHTNFRSYVNGMIPQDWNHMSEMVWTGESYEWTDKLPDINEEED